MDIDISHETGQKDSSLKMFLTENYLWKRKKEDAKCSHEMTKSGKRSYDKFNVAVAK